MRVIKIGFFLLAMCATTSIAYAANDEATANGSQRPSRRELNREFRLGICVGQKLAEASIDVEALAPANIDDTTKAAIKDAMRACRPQKKAWTDGSSSSSSSSSAE